MLLKKTCQSLWDDLRYMYVFVKKIVVNIVAHKCTVEKFVAGSEQKCSVYEWLLLFCDSIVIWKGI